MDSEQRHELKENDLRELLRNSGTWLNKYGTQILLVVAVVVLAFVAVRWFTGREDRLRQSAWAAYATSATPEGLAQLGEQHQQRLPGLAAMALLDAADRLRREAVLGIGPADPAPTAAPTLTDAQRESLQRAADYYQRVIDMPDAPLLHRLNAHMGMAATQISLDDRDAALDHYRTAMREAGPWSPIAALANRELRTLEQLPPGVVLAVKPPESEGPAEREDADEADAAAEAGTAPIPDAGEADDQVGPVEGDEVGDGDGGAASDGP